jgi:hypothetical protein
MQKSNIKKGDGAIFFMATRARLCIALPLVQWCPEEDAG